uniref:Uncharacterized protein n=1 Tax=Quercus lobata TaxID=97700 RepID=A0A7N2N4S9_QUELO
MSPPYGYCSRGNSSSEPYIAAQNILLAHASAARLYQKNIRFLNPLVFGDYPNIMKQNAGARMPVFTNHESKLVKGSFDFIGVIHYISMYVKDISNGLKMVYRDVFMDVEIELTGQQMQRNSTLDDIARVKYMRGYIGGVLDALRNGSNTRGYLTWAFLVIFELIGGYGYSYGINYVDLDDPDLKRYPKLSAKWYSNFLKGRSINFDGVIELEKSPFSLSLILTFSRLCSYYGTSVVVLCCL